jgi:hypothetical protein
MVKRNKVLICLTTLLLSGLLIGCQENADPAESPSPTQEVTASPTESESPAESDIPVESDAPTDASAERQETSEKERNPNLDWELIDFPDLEGFEKLVVEEEAMVVYSKDMVSMIVQYLEATQEQLDQIAQGGGDSLQQLFGQLSSAETISAGQMIDLPGLDRQGLELQFAESDGSEYDYVGLLVPSNGQVLALFGMSMADDEQVLLDGYDQLIQKLTA